MLHVRHSGKRSASRIQRAVRDSGQARMTALREASNYKMRNSLGLTPMAIILIVATIIAIGYIAFLFLNPMAKIREANDAKRKADLSRLQKVFEKYYQDNGRYPCSTSSTVPPCKADAPSYRLRRLDGEVADWGKQWLPYMDVLPKDPDNLRNYVYVVSNNGQAYWLYAFLERGVKDKEACNDGAVCLGVPKNETCGRVCNYGVSSPNVSP